MDWGFVGSTTVAGALLAYAVWAHAQMTRYRHAMFKAREEARWYRSQYAVARTMETMGHTGKAHGASSTRLPTRTGWQPTMRSFSPKSTTH